MSTREIWQDGTDDTDQAWEMAASSNLVLVVGHTGGSFGAEYSGSGNKQPVAVMLMTVDLTPASTPSPTFTSTSASTSSSGSYVLVESTSWSGSSVSTWEIIAIVLSVAASGIVIALGINRYLLVRKRETRTGPSANRPDAGDGTIEAPSPPAPSGSFRGVVDHGSSASTILGGSAVPTQQERSETFRSVKSTGLSPDEPQCSPDVSRRGSTSGVEGDGYTRIGKSITISSRSH